MSVPSDSPASANSPAGLSRRDVRWVALILACHAALLVYSGYIHTPAWDEMGHLPAGVAHWQSGVFDLYRVNPPLVRLSATVVPFVLGARLDFDDAALTCPPWRRNEFSNGSNWFRADGEAFQNHLRLARWSVIPFSLAAGWWCFTVARELYGTISGYLALVLWCTSPMVLAHGSLITPDIGAAAAGVFSLGCFYRWMQSPTRRQTVITGLALGLALLTKFTNLLLVGWLLLLLTYRLFRPGMEQPKRRDWILQTVGIGLLALYVIAFGYGFEHLGKRLGNFQFVSVTLGGPLTDRQEPHGNRFAGTVLGAIPVPLPENYLLGIDVQKHDFEKKMMSYLNGEWKLGGWWYYYLEASVIKEPLGTLALLLLACISLPALSPSQRKATLFWLLLPATAVMALVSSQTGFNHHLRYVLPMYPLLYVFASSVASAGTKWRCWLGIVLVSTATMESLAVFPHSLTFFNRAVGGPEQGWKYLNHSSVDWGQDALLLADWARVHPEARPLQIVFSGGFNPRDLPVWQGAVLHRELSDTEAEALAAGELRDRWVAISVNKLSDPYDKLDRYRYFRTHKPDATVGYTYRIYDLTKLVTEEKTTQP